ncbi:MAG: PorV/PorQ family protein [Candidatus Cloacimonetes bacterium]|nr:PorV/PorQ family protein [Candidatus Cloacimonadota bacterium]
MHRDFVTATRFLVVAACLLTALPLAALKVDGDAGAYGFQMLKIPASAAIAACGGTGAASGSDALGFFEHPATPLRTRTSAISFSSTYWMFDTKLNTVAYTRHSGSRSFGLGMRYLDYGKFDTVDDVSQIIGEFHPMDLDAVLNFSYRITPSHFAGVNVHLLYEKIHTASSWGACADIGWVWLTPLEGLRTGLTAKYLGGTSAMDSESIDLPYTLEALVAKDVILGGVDFTAEGRAIKHPDDDNAKAALGLNARLLGTLDLRFGYKFNYDVESFSAGFGVAWKRLRVDYAYLPFIEDGSDDIHIIGLSFML